MEESPPSSIVSSSTKSKFPNDLDFRYRFRSLKTFRNLKQPQRPFTSPEKGFRRRGVNQNALDRIASVQSPSPELIHYALGDGILMLREKKSIFPSVFINLKERLKEERRSQTADVVTRPGVAPVKVQPPKKARSRTSPPDVKHSRYASIGVQTDPPTPKLAARRPSTVSELATSYTLDQTKKTESYRRRTSGYQMSSGMLEQRCTRCSHLPDIQIDGRSLNRFLTTANSLMASQHCEILGANACPDCQRTRCQYNYESVCNAAVEPNANDVYKLQVIRSKLPFLDFKEVKRRVYDGQISDTINQNILHMDLDSPRTNDEQYADEPTSILHSRSYPKNVGFSTIPEVSSADEEVLSTPSTDVTDDDINSAKVRIQRHESSDYYERMNVEFSETDNKRRPRRIEFVDSGVFNQAPGDNYADDAQFAPSTPTAQISSLASDVEFDIGKSMSVNISKKPRHSVSFTAPKVLLRKQGRPINKNITPSPTFFYNISDLYRRLQKQKTTYQRSDSVNLTLAVAHMNLGNPPQVPSETRDEVEEDSGSDSSLSPRSLKSLLQFEPPIMYEKKGRYLGVASPEVGNISKFVKRESGAIPAM